MLYCILDSSTTPQQKPLRFERPAYPSFGPVFLCFFTRAGILRSVFNNHWMRYYAVSWVTPHTFIMGKTPCPPGPTKYNKNKTKKYYAGVFDFVFPFLFVLNSTPEVIGIKQKPSGIHRTGTGTRGTKITIQPQTLMVPLYISIVLFLVFILLNNSRAHVPNVFNSTWSIGEHVVQAEGVESLALPHGLRYVSPVLPAYLSKI